MSMNSSPTESQFLETESDMLQTSPAPGTPRDVWWGPCGAESEVAAARDGVVVFIAVSVSAFNAAVAVAATPATAIAMAKS